MRFQKITPLLAVVFILALLLSACDAVNLGSVFASNPEFVAVANAASSQELQLGQTRFFGSVVSISEDRIKVDDVVFRVDSNSNMPDLVRIGETVAIDALLLPDQSRYIVSLVSADKSTASSDSSALEFKLFGQVEGQGGESWIVSGEILNVSADTVIEPGISLSNLVEVEGRLVNGVLQAATIQLEDSVPGYPVGTVTVMPPVSGTPAATTTVVVVSGNEIEFYGVLESNSGASWTIAGTTVMIVPQTQIKGNLVVGDFVKVHAWQQQDGSLIAREIEKEDDSGSEFENDKDEVKGVITAINGDSITVAGVLVLINSFTEVKGSFQIGDYVEVEGLLQSDGSILAREIKQDDGYSDNSDDMDDDSDDDMDDDQNDDSDDGTDDDSDDGPDNDDHGTDDDSSDDDHDTGDHDKYKGDD
jgi:hypothetical protein